MTSGFIEVTERTEDSRTILINIDHIITVKPVIWKSEEKEIGATILLSDYSVQTKEKYHDIRKLMDEAMHRVLIAAARDASGTDYKRIV